MSLKLICIVWFPGLSLLKVGGRMIYSTCSMNPIEDEAVVAQVIFFSSFFVKTYMYAADIFLLDSEEVWMLR